jgi:hypothetical protein
VLGKVTWGALKPFTYVGGGGDDGFGGNTHITDLNGDGWNDILICDVDIDVVDCSKRLHIFHNTGSVPGADLTMKEEAELGSGGTGPGWKGVVGMKAGDLTGAYDVAIADFDRDGDTDMLVGRCSGSFFWENQAAPAYCQADVGHGGPGAMQLSICGVPLDFEGAPATLALTGGVPLKPVFLAVGPTDAPTPLKGGTLVPSPPAAVLLGLATDGVGSLKLPLQALGSSTVTLYLQVIVKNGPVFEFSNAVELVIGL